MVGSHLVAMHLLHRIHRHDAHDGRAVCGRLGESPSQIVSISMNGRTASCTATRSVSDRDGCQSILHRLLPAESPPSTRRTGFGEALLRAAAPLTQSDILRPQRHHDLGDRRRRHELADGMQQDGRTVQQHELLAAGAGLLRRRLRPMRGTQPGGGRMTETFMQIADLTSSTPSRAFGRCGDRCVLARASRGVPRGCALS